jgi:hypothetical protein
LAAVCTAYPASPFLPFFHPPIELASFRPGGRLYLHRWTDPSAIRVKRCCAWLNMVEIFFGIITRKAIRRHRFRTTSAAAR